MVLAGVGGLSAKTMLNLNDNFLNPSESTQLSDKYWYATGLNFNDVRGFISNHKCKGFGSYYKSCLSAVIQNVGAYNLKISPNAGSLIKSSKSDYFEEKSEKELMHIFGKGELNINFDEALDVMFAAESESKRPALAGKLINAFMSVYFDPHTYLMPSDFYLEVGSKMERSKYFVGISYQKEKGDFYIRKLAKNSDAELAGFKINDRILSINSFKTKNLRYSEMSSLLKDETAANMQFEILRDQKVMRINMQRSLRQLSYVQYNEIGPDKSYGLLTLGKFSAGACAETAKILKNVNKSRVSGLVVDLRDNPGGQLDEAACIQGLFLGENKKAYYIDYFSSIKPNEVVLTSEKQIYKGPVVVLINSQSASAAELVAGSFQEYGRALAIGERTFGKGTFQEPERWGANSKISLFKTQGYYLLPSRNSTQIEGVKPDVELPSASFGKRESDLFFNPVAVPKFKYEKTKSALATEKFIYSDCDTNKAEALISDLYLQQSLKYLGCAKAIKKQLAVQSRSATMIN